MDRLLSLRVADVMCHDLVEVSLHDTIEQAAAKFAQHDVSGAPVVDETGRCVGVITSGDFVRREVQRQQQGGEILSADAHKLVEGDHGQSAHVETTTEDIVSRYMSPAVQTVHADAPLVTAARMMDAEHIHRLIVVDEGGFPVGLVSSMDVVAAVINSVDEMLAESSRV